MQQNVKVKILRSLGTAQGVLNPGAVQYLDERTAESWEANGLIEILERPEPSKQPEGDDQDGQEEDGADKQPEQTEGPADNKESNEALQAAVETPEAKKPAARNSKAKK